MRVTIIADASFCPETGATGYAYSVTTSCRENSNVTKRLFNSGSLQDPVQDSTVAEIAAIAIAIYGAINEGLTSSGDLILVQSDCTAALRAIQAERDWRPGTETNVLTAIHAMCHSNNFTVECRHVRGHTSHEGKRYHLNRKCDIAAKAQMRSRRQEFIATQNTSEVVTNYD